MTTAIVNARVEPLITQLGYVQRAFKVNTSGITHEESLVQPATGGNCLNWVVGHIVATRNSILKHLGKDPVWDEEKAARYRRGSEPISGQDDGGLVPFERMLADYDASQQAIVEGLKEISDEELTVLVPWFGQDQPKAVALAGLVFHEAYHVGQTGLLRRLAGKDGAIK